MAILLTVMQGNLLEIWRMRVQLLPGLIFAGSDTKAEIRPGIEASERCAKQQAESTVQEVLQVILPEAV